MAVSLYVDVHVPRAITDQLRRCGVDVLTAIEDGRAEATDEDLLELAYDLERVLFTQDIRFKAMAENWLRERRPTVRSPTGRDDRPVCEGPGTDGIGLRAV
jgi:predicted nuclease of predicted toxin-antitoxin system